MPCWYYDKNDLRDTPSIHDDINYETERRYRKEGARFIMTCGTQMGLGHNTMATGVVYFHRFYMFHSFKSFPRYVTACCCLLLAGKVEETPKKCRDIIKTARGLLTDTYFYSFGVDPKEEVMTLERILLQTIKFDLQVEHPYTFLLKYAKCFKGDQQKLQKMVQMAWNFVNDSLSTTVCLQWEPEIIAVALIHLASKLSKFTVLDWVGRQPSHARWWDMFVSDVTMEILEDICHQVLDLYQSSQKDPSESQSPPQKPPSRADSPTPMKNIITSSIANTGSPASKTKSTVNPIAITTATTTPAAANATAGNNNAVGMEINNIQAIKSLANSTPIIPMSLDMPAASAAALNNAWYAGIPPHQLQSLYGGSAAAPLSASAASSYGVVGAGNAATAVSGGNAWAALAPPPAPPTVINSAPSGGGYYQPPSYGRQQQQQQRY